VEPAPVVHRRRRVEGIDLLRGVAISLVLARHAWPDVFQGAGVAGIVVFFTLSGYLITGILTHELRATGRVSFGRFYSRRARRLVPALLVMMAVFVIVTLTIDPLRDREELGRTVLVALSYTADLPIRHGSSAIFHLWTLAVEEQFYLVWPAFLAVAWARRRLVAGLLLAAFVTASACVAGLIWLAPEYDLAYALPSSWSLCFVLGAGTRVLADRLEENHEVASQSPMKPTLAGLALAGLAIASVIPLRGQALTYLVGGPVIAVLTCVLLMAWRAWFVVAPRLLRPLVALGTISYAVYLWNYPLTLWLRPSAGEWAGLAGIVASILVAMLSWRFVEDPIMRRGRDTGAAIASSPSSNGTLVQRR
jgi:peptidoglycan/LPS O-acetylase OafA/YrhL